MPRMRTWSSAVLGFAVLGGCIQATPPAAISSAQQANKPAVSGSNDSTVAEKDVITAEGTGEFTVNEKNLVRLTGNAIAGGQTSAVVKGPAKLVRINHLTTLVDGKPLIGASISEFEIQPTGKGKVEVVITKTSPIPGVKPEDETVVFTVE